MDEEDVCETEKDFHRSNLDKDGCDMSTYVAKGDYSLCYL
jgi:hypothetical protein